MSMSLRNEVMQMNRNIYNRGFTLVEILIVMSIIGMLFAIIVPQVNSYFVKSYESGIRTDFRSFQQSTEMYLRDSINNDVSIEKLNKYLDRSNQITEQDGKNVTRKQDPWGTSYSVHHELEKVTFISHGKDAVLSSNVYTLTSYIYKNVVDSCTYGFNTGNLKLTKIKNVPDNFVCGEDLVLTSSDPVTGGLNTPSDFKATEVSGKRAVLSWNSVSNATGYILKRDGLVVYKGSSLSFTDITLDNSKTYVYELASYNNSNTSAYGNITVTTSEAPIPPKQDGTCEFPYIITDVTGLQNMKNNLNTCYALGNDIDASAKASGAGFAPIGTYMNAFKGTLDGKGFAITGLTINRPFDDSIGLFAHVMGAKIKNIEFVNAKIKGNKNKGVLVGEAHSNTIIENVLVGGIIIGADPSGIVGTGDGSGGLVGVLDSGSIIRDSHSTVDINATLSLGGLVGVVENATILRSSATGNVSLNTDSIYSSHAGGLVGEADKSSIEQSFATGDVSGRTNGGLVGRISNATTVLNSYASGFVVESDFRFPFGGGLVGDAFNSTISNSYATGQSSSLVSFPQNTNIINSHYDTFTSNNFSLDTDSIMETTAEMKRKTTYQGWDFESVWSINEGIGYPKLRNNVENIEKQVVSIGTCEELQDMNKNLKGYYVLEKDIDCTNSVSWNNGKGFIPVGDELSNHFRGSLDGKGYSINGLTINRPTDQSIVGLFGVTHNSNLKNISFKNANMRGAMAAGTIVGVALGSTHIEGVYTSGTVESEGASGGVVGWLFMGSTVTHSHSNSIVKGQGESSYSGGLVGFSEMYAVISKSSATNNVFGYSSDSVSGGLVGGISNMSSIEESFASGKVQSAKSGGLVGEVVAGSKVAKSYYDKNMTGKSDTGKGTGKTTAEMKAQTTYVGWDFTDTWTMQPSTNNGYPYLLKIVYSN